MGKIIDGNAIVYAEGAFRTTYGKTAHGLVRFTNRYSIHGVIDSTCQGQDAGEVLDGKKNGIVIFKSVDQAVKTLISKGINPEYFVIGLAPDGGRIDDKMKKAIKKAIRLGLNIDSGLHDYLNETPELIKLAKKHKVQLRDVRRPPARDLLHNFEGKISKVNCLKLAVLGTDSAIGKRTTARILEHGMISAGYNAIMVGTGQTSWMQGAKYSMMLDSIVNDFLAGEIEHAVYEAWRNEHPDVIIIEGQGSLMNPAYPGGFEILAAGRPDFIILQHAPKRIDYDGFPGYPIHPLETQIQALELISGRKVIAITVNHEDLKPEEIDPACDAITRATGLPAVDVLTQGADKLVDVVSQYLNRS